MSPLAKPGHALRHVTSTTEQPQTGVNTDVPSHHTHPTCTATRKDLSVGEHLFLAGERRGVWQLRQGVMRLESHSPTGTSFVRLALPGDLLGAEAALHQPYTFSAVAVTDCEVIPVDASTDAQRQNIITSAFLQEQDRAADAMRMRQGSVAARLDYLLQILDTGMDHHEPASVRQRKLPQLRDLAFMIDSTPESACRYLTRHLGLHRQRRYRRTAAVHAATSSTAVTAPDRLDAMAMG